MKRKILSIIGVAAVVVAVAFNINADRINSNSTFGVYLGIIESQAGNEGGITIDLGDHQCVCKNYVCKDAGLFPMNPPCGYVYPGTATDSNCAIISSGC